MPAWRRQLRSRVFRTTLLVVLVHVICWLPYNIFTVLLLASEQDEWLSEKANICKALQVRRELYNSRIERFHYCSGSSRSSIRSSMLSETGKQ